MTNISLVLLSILSGVLILLQSSLSGQLSKYTQSPFISSLALYSMSSLVMIVIAIFFKLRLPSYELLRDVPKHLWIAGSFFSIIGLTIVYWLMPIIGVSKVVAGIITGQLIGGMIISHFGLFGLPVVEIDRLKIFGIVFLLIGIFLTNWSSINGSVK